MNGVEMAILFISTKIQPGGSAGDDEGRIP
jgi:hypothetical protein